MALYLLQYNAQDRFATPEPLGPGGNPYPAMYGQPDQARLDRWVTDTANDFRAREAAILSL